MHCRTNTLTTVSYTHLDVYKRQVVEVVGIPVIASGGCGSLEHFSEVFEKTGCDAALAASLFHYRELTVGEVKEHLQEHNIPVRR